MRYKQPPLLGHYLLLNYTTNEQYSIQKRLKILQKVINSFFNSALINEKLNENDLENGSTV